MLEQAREKANGNLKSALSTYEEQLRRRESVVGAAASRP